jgi:competence/damage-inducible protein CinA-like protein
MPVLEIITIGTELLLGEIVDTNSTYIARTLRDHGIDIYRITTIGDNPNRIAATIREALRRADIIITTGGLGPTVDDPTRQAVADAVDVALVFVDQLWDQILERFKAYGRPPTQNNRRQAYIPSGAIPIANPVGTAPCFIVEQGASSIISLPGVPQEMKYILHQEVIPFLKDKYQLQSQIIKATVLHLASVGESVIDEAIADLENYANPTVGLLAHPGQVDVRVTAKAQSEVEAQEMIQPILAELYQRLGDHIYGRNGDTLAGVIAALLEKHDLQVTILTFGLNDFYEKHIHQAYTDRIKVIPLTALPPEPQALVEEVNRRVGQQDGELGFGLVLQKTPQVEVYIVYQDANQTITKTRRFGGPRENAPLWAANIGLDELRRKLTQFISNHQTGES